ncbi:MAG: metal-sensitive transcriptional regulator [Fimbriimonadaceae bacterium]|jgi:DNA-binding FrmR family transcriptional regulator
MKQTTKEDSVRRLHKISGQVAGIQKMIDQGRDCSDILQQVVAVRAALDQLGVVLLTQHLQTCVLRLNVTGEADYCHTLPEEQWSEEIKKSLTRFLK